MADVINRTTLVYIQSVNTPDYPIEDWVINPDMSGVAGVPQRYWKLVGDLPTEMTVGEKAVVDANLAQNLINNNQSRSILDIDGNTIIGYELRGLVELLNKRDNYIITRLIELQNRVQAMLDSTGDITNMKTDGLAVSISNTATRPRPDAVTSYKDSITAGDIDV